MRCFYVYSESVTILYGTFALSGAEEGVMSMRLVTIVSSILMAIYALSNLWRPSISPETRAVPGVLFSDPTSKDVTELVVSKLPPGEVTDDVCQAFNVTRGYIDLLEGKLLDPADEAGREATAGLLRASVGQLWSTAFVRLKNDGFLNCYEYQDGHPYYQGELELLRELGLLIKLYGLPGGSPPFNPMFIILAEANLLPGIEI